MLPAGATLSIVPFGTGSRGDIQIDTFGLWQVPEPSAAGLALIGTIAAATRRRRGR
jgi:hypothetical protein